jgi:predicted enzyme related to lactoylglutathione lyase
MAKVLGVGGVFFKSPDPVQLRAWYERWLGVPDRGFGMDFAPSSVPPGGYTVWSPFAADTRYFDPGGREFMINLMVDDLDGALAQVRNGGANVMDRREESEYGRFGWFLDPDGNKVELWQPPPPASGKE